MNSDTPQGYTNTEIHIGNELSFVQILILYRTAWIEEYLTSSSSFLTLLWKTEKWFICLFIYGTFNNAVTISNCVVLNNKMINEWWIG
jgi:hypothetical protein